MIDSAWHTADHNYICGITEVIALVRWLRAHPTAASNSGWPGSTLWAHIKVCLPVGGQQGIPILPWSPIL